MPKQVVENDAAFGDDIVEVGTDIVPLNSVDSMMEPADVEEDEVDTTVVGAVEYSSRPNFSGHIAYPLMRIAQPMTGEVANQQAKVGQLVLQGYKPLDKVTFIPGLFATTRVYALGTGSDRKTLCSSNDAVKGIGVPDLLTVDGYTGSCLTCPFNQWTARNDGSGKNNPPKCDLHLDYIGYVPEFRSFVKFTFKKTGARTAENMNATLAQRGLGYVAFEISAYKAPAAQNYWIPSVTIIDDYDEAVMERTRQQLGIK